MFKFSLKYLLLVVGILGIGLGLAIQWHRESSRQHKILVANITSRLTGIDDSGGFEGYLDDAVCVDKKGLLCFMGLDLEQSSPYTVSYFGLTMKRTYFRTVPLVWVYDTSETTACKIKQLKSVKQIVVWDEDTEGSVSTWENWFPGVTVVLPKDIGY